MPGDKILLRVLEVGKLGVQAPFFKAAQIEFARLYPEKWENIIVQYLYNDIIRIHQMTPKEVIDWLLSAHFHFILAATHIKESAFYLSFLNGMYLF